MKFTSSILCLFFILNYQISYSQGYWMPKANYTGIYPPSTSTTRHFQFFAINNSGYIIPDGNPACCSSPVMYAYDAIANTWSQKANVPEINFPQTVGQEAWRGYSTSFAVGSKGYVTCGFNTGVNFETGKDLFEYDPITNLWTKKADFAGNYRSEVSAAGNSTKGYLGLGQDVNGYKKDWYEYNPTANSYATKASLPAIGINDRLGSFSYNGKIYVLTATSFPALKELWEYDPTLNNWTMRFSLPISTAKFYFIVNGKAIFNIGNAAGWSLLDLTNFTWQHGLNPPTTYWEGASINGRAFILGTANDFYEYITLDIMPGNVPTVLCGGSQRNLSYTINGTFNSGNVFNVELSDASGSFSAPIIIGSAVGTASGTITYTVPQSAPAGSGYRVRISSTSPAMVGFNNGTDISINMPPATPDICMVTVDQPSNFNILYWNKTLYAGVDSFIIHRETTTNIYKRIGAVAFTDSSAYIDTARSIGPANGDPNITSYRYKLQIKDTCGNFGGLSPYHTSIYFNDLLNGSFIWNTYQIEGQPSTPISYFELMRDDISNGNFSVIGAAAGTANSLNDPNYNTYKTTAVWRVQGNGLNCTYALKNGANNTPQAQVVKSKSNIRNNFTTTVNTRLLDSEYMNSYVKVYPNPAENLLHIDLFFKNGNATIYIINILGQSVYSAKTSVLNNIIDVSSLERGVYTVKVVTEKGQMVQKTLIE